jgi:phosphatidylglycerol---prolipoprotein diacylglyceryl transferase
MSFTILGLTFHVYGLIAGSAMMLGVLFAEYQAKKHSFEEKMFWKVVATALVFGIIGARFYHVWTDWGLYQNDLLSSFYVWRGGLSIIGGLFGGLIGIVISTWWNLPQAPNKAEIFLKLLRQIGDICALSLPFAQAFGRLANYFNQEVYGLPTSLPWAIGIDPQHRSVGYEQFTHFHPLFAYEAIGMIILGMILWWLERTKKWAVGSGNFFLSYIAWYGIFRGLLEFLRVEKASFLGTQLGLNQVILFISGTVGLASFMYFKTKFKKTQLSLVALFFLCALTFSGCRQKKNSPVELPEPAVPTKTQLLQNEDRSVVAVQFKRQSDQNVFLVQVEVVNTDQSRTQGLSGRDAIGQDGMLFVFPEAKKHSFWMKDMKFDLDFIWLEDGRVVEITKNVPHPEENGQSTASLPAYVPQEPISMMLEVPAGTAEKWSLQVGDAFELP